MKLSLYPDGSLSRIAGVDASGSVVCSSELQGILERISEIEQALESLPESEGVPIGTIAFFASFPVPGGWVRLRGQSVEEGSKAGLWAQSIGIIPTGGMCVLPDTLDRVIVGADESGKVVLSSGGSYSKTIVAGNLPTINCNSATLEKVVVGSGNQKFLSNQSVGASVPLDVTPKYLALYVAVYVGV